MIFHLHEEHVAGFVEADFVRLIEERLRGLASLSGVPLLPAPRHNLGCAALKIDSPHTMIAHFADIQPAIRPDLDSKWLANVDFNCLSFRAVIVRLPGARDGLNRLGGTASGGHRNNE